MPGIGELFPSPADPGKSLVVRRMLEFKADLTARDADTILVMSRQWLILEEALEADISLLLQEIAAAGLESNLQRIYKLNRYRKLLTQIRREKGRYDAWAADYIAEHQQQMAILGINNAHEALSLVLLEGGSSAFFDKLPVSAIELMVGNAGKGGPVFDLLQARYPETVERMTGAMISGLTMGLPPGQVARTMIDGIGYGLNHALTVARTEMLRVYREASRQQYDSTGAVTGYKRFAAKDPRTCPLCLALDGEVYPTDELMNVHPNDRCIMVPIVRGVPEITWETGEEWLRRQDPAIQQGVLGPTAFEAWDNGQIELRDLVNKTEHPIWGPSLERVPMSSLIETPGL